MKKEFTIINHGLINKIYYDSKNISDKIYRNQALIEKLTNYFKRYKGRDKYYVVMKHHSMKLLTSMKLSTKEIANIINYTNHSTVVTMRKHYVKVDGYDEFINDYFMYCVDNFIYPIVKKRGKLLSEYSYEYNFININEDGKKQQVEKPS